MAENCGKSVWFWIGLILLVIGVGLIIAYSIFYFEKKNKKNTHIFLIAGGAVLFVAGLLMVIFLRNKSCKPKGVDMNPMEGAMAGMPSSPRFGMPGQQQLQQQNPTYPYGFPAMQMATMPSPMNFNLYATPNYAGMNSPGQYSM